MRNTEPANDPRPSPAVSKYALLAAVTMLSVMLGGLWQVGAALGLPKTRAVPASWADFRAGRSTAALEKAIDQALPQRSLLILCANALRYRLLAGADAQVRVGNAGWLFLTEEIRHYPQSAATMQTRLSEIAALSQRLNARGIALQVLLVPDKARVQSEYRGFAVSAAVASRYREALRQLREQNVAAIDLLTPMQAARANSGTDWYYHSDTHWNQAGAKLAAQVVATELAGLLPAQPPTRFSTRPHGPRSERVGDLINLMGLQAAPPWLRPAGDWEQPEITEQVSQGEADADALFGDNAVPVVLVGTSYSRRANFHGYLQQALAVNVLNAAQDGGGLLQSLQAYLSDDAFRDSPPQILLWELPERFLPIPETPEQHGWLQRVLPAEG